MDDANVLNSQLGEALTLTPNLDNDSNELSDSATPTTLAMLSGMWVIIINPLNDADSNKVATGDVSYKVLTAV